MAFILSGSSHKPMPSWKLYIQKASTVNREKTTVASRYLPIIQDPAFELDTLNTVAKRVLPCSQIDGTAACRSDGGRDTLSKAAETEVVDRRVKGHTYTLPWRTSHCHALSGYICTSIDADYIAQKVDKLTTVISQHHIKWLVVALTVDEPNTEFLWNYMTIVSIIFCFTRARCDGSSDLHLYAFKCMLPFLFGYDHVNHARWGTVYLAEVSVLRPEVLLEFQEGNFVVKRTN
ncbi:hypothetical protein LSH36_240g02005 [Paralvinella palmiformis]|uniref:Uncharacterized protein n=1 Tax=Paralvinella palmiformis TaxID=53620 RepID=A0AAD9JMY9_9ANNE|nr:hypothetical protein LSH36_240g02005 [Paralvinella palmiformis]